MTREMNKPEYIEIVSCLKCANYACEYKKHLAETTYTSAICTDYIRERKLDDWIKPFVDSVNERFKQC